MVYLPRVGKRQKIFNLALNLCLGFEPRELRSGSLPSRAKYTDVLTKTKCHDVSAWFIFLDASLGNDKKYPFS